MSNQQEKRYTPIEFREYVENGIQLGVVPRFIDRHTACNVLYTLRIPVEPFIREYGRVEPVDVKDIVVYFEQVAWGDPNVTGLRPE